MHCHILEATQTNFVRYSIEITVEIAMFICFTDGTAVGGGCAMCLFMLCMLYFYCFSTVSVTPVTPNAVDCCCTTPINALAAD